MKSRQVQSVNNYGANFIILMLGFLGCTFGALYLLVSHAPGVASGWGHIVPVILLGLLGLLCGKAMLEWDKLTIDGEKLEVRSLLGYVKKEIYLDEIIRWTEIDKKNKYVTWTDLVIFTAGTKYKITSTCYKNYDSLKRALVKQNLRDTVGEKAWERRNELYYSAGSGIIGLFFLVAAIHSYSKRDEVVLPEQIHVMAGVVSNELRIGRGSKGARFLKIQLAGYPGYTFEVSGDAYRASYALDFVERVKWGDSVFIGIDKDMYRKKFTREQPLASEDRFMDMQLVFVMELRDKEYDYLSLADYNEESKPKISSIISMLVIGLFCLGLSGLLAYRKKPGTV